MSFLAQAELESEFNARYDYVSEAYGELGRDCDRMAAEDEEQELAEWLADMEPAFGPYVRPEPVLFHFPQYWNLPPGPAIDGVPF